MAGWFGENINSRSDFFRELARARQTAEQLIQRLPAELPLQFVAKQLADMQQWTAKGRTPTQAERDSVHLAIVLFKEYEMTEDDEILALRAIAPWLTYYVKFWPDDRTAADPNNEDYLEL